MIGLDEIVVFDQKLGNYTVAALIKHYKNEGKIYNNYKTQIMSKQGRCAKRQSAMCSCGDKQVC